MKNVSKLMPKLSIVSLTIFVLMLPTASYAGGEFRLLCSQPLFVDQIAAKRGTGQSPQPVDDKKLCNLIGELYQLKYGDEYGFQVLREIEPEREAVRAMISSSVAGAGGYDVWIGGKEYYHALASKKGLTVSMEKATILVQRKKRAIFVSFPREASSPKFAYMFLDWLKSAKFDW